MLMGTGNLTELTDADFVGVTAMLLGICSELGIANALIVQVSPHTRRTIQEHDAARRIMFAARRTTACRKATGARCCKCTTVRRFRTPSEEIAEFAAEVKDDNFRIEAADDGIHAITGTAISSARTLSPCSISSASKRTARTRSISARS